MVDRAAPMWRNVDLEDLWLEIRAYVLANPDEAKARFDRFLRWLHTPAAGHRHPGYLVRVCVREALQLLTWKDYRPALFGNDMPSLIFQRELTNDDRRIFEDGTLNPLEEVWHRWEVCATNIGTSSRWLLEHDYYEIPGGWRLLGEKERVQVGDLVLKWGWWVRHTRDGALGEMARAPLWIRRVEVEAVYGGEQQGLFGGAA
jgi:hypothetical protein